MTLTLGSPASRRVVLFAAGAGGDPRRYRPLLNILADHGYCVIAPEFARIDAATATTQDLLIRPHGLIEALDAAVKPNTEIAFIGHSIGGWAGLCLAGATPREADGTIIDVPRDPRLNRLVLYAPAVGWFWHSDALDGMTLPTRIYVGAKDTITPPTQAQLLTTARGDAIDVRVIDHVGHFTFMHHRPPGVVEDDSALDLTQFFDDLAESTLHFLQTDPTKNDGTVGHTLTPSDPERTP